jgi:ferrous iron transport protein B
VTAHYVAKQDNPPKRLTYAKDLEEVILEIAGNLDGKAAMLEPEPFAIKLLEGDIQWQDQIHDEYPQLLPKLNHAQLMIEQTRGQSADWVISGERQALAANLASAVVVQGERRVSWRDRIDDILLHPVFGYVALVLIMFLFFEIVYGIGSILETPLLNIFSQLEVLLDNLIGADTLLGASLIGIVQGIAGGVAIVFPRHCARNSGRSGNRLPILGPISIGVRLSRRYWLSTKNCFPNGYFDEADWSSWKCYRSFYFRLWM